MEKSYKTYLSHIESQQVNLHTYEAMISREVFELYEIDGADLEQILRDQGAPLYLPPCKSRCSVPIPTRLLLYETAKYHNHR